MQRVMKDIFSYVEIFAPNKSPREEPAVPARGLFQLAARKLLASLVVRVLPGSSPGRRFHRYLRTEQPLPPATR